MDYQHIAESFLNTHTVNRRIFFELISQFSTKKAIKVLDFGCGTGNYIKAMQTNTNYDIYGVEPCDEMIAYAKRNNPNIIIKKGNHANIPYPDKYFDYVYMTNVVHHVEDLSLMYKEIYRVLKPNGILCICTESRWQLLSKYWIKYFPSIIAKDLQRFPSISTLKSVAKKQKMQTLKITQTKERKWTYITNFLIQQITERSMSVLNLLSDDEYNKGKEKILAAQKRRKKHLCLRGYTFLWFRKVK